MQILYQQLIILSSTNKIAKHAPNFPRLSMRENKCARLSRKKNRAFVGTSEHVERRDETRDVYGQKKENHE